MASSLQKQTSNSFGDFSGFNIGGAGAQSSPLETSEEDEDRPLLEELGVDIFQILEKIRSVVLFKSLKNHKNNDWDLAGKLHSKRVEKIENYTRNGWRRLLLIRSAPNSYCTWNVLNAGRYLFHSFGV